jgi:hypothetical protein
VGALARLDIADHLAGGPRGVADLAGAAGADPGLPAAEAGLGQTICDYYRGQPARARRSPGR